MTLRRIIAGIVVLARRVECTPKVRQANRGTVAPRGPRPAGSDRWAKNSLTHRRYRANVAAVSGNFRPARTAASTFFTATEATRARAERSPNSAARPGSPEPREIALRPPKATRRPNFFALPAGSPGARKQPVRRRMEGENDRGFTQESRRQS